MIRKLAFALSLLGVCFTGFVHALGLGEAEVKSSLNQPLKAEIDLVNVKDLGFDEILPGLASREEFLKAGVDRVYFLSDIRFKVEQNAAGKMVVVLTTNKPVREPFLNFLVEVIWPSGRLLREYALLIDPPVFTEQKAQPIQSPVTATSSQASSAVSSTKTVQKQTGDVVSLAPKSVTQAPASRVEAGSSYGPTSSKDTLWDIASKARPNRNVSPQQVMLAIQDLNPSAFIDQNINKLKTGQVLRLPTLDQIKKRSSYQAINEVIAQNEALRPVKRKAVVSASNLKTPQAQATKTVAAGDELKLVVSDSAASPADSASSGDAESGGASKASTEELAVTLEKLDKANSENKELSGRLEDLEGQLETLQRLLTLKNDQLANLQEQMQANELARLKEEQEQLAADAEGAETAGEMKESEAEVASSESDAVVTDKATEAANQEVAQVEAAAADKDEAEAKVVETKEAKPVETKVAKAKETPSKPAADNYFDMILSNPLYLAVGAALLLVLLIILWLVSRRNAEKEQSLYESSDYDTQDQQDDYVDEQAEEFDEEEGLAADTVVDEELDDDVISQDEEEDPIAEADVYIAYGRLDQAAGILEEAVSKDPVRVDFRLKLLEVYKESNDLASFDKQFSELEAIQDAQAIEQASAMRAEFAENDLVTIEDLEQELIQEGREPEESQELYEEEVAIAAEEEALEQEGNTFDFDPVDQDDEVETELEVDLDSEDLDVDLDIDLNVDEQANLSSDEDESSFDASMLESDFDTSALDDALNATDDNLLDGVDSESSEIDDSLLEQGLEAEGLGEVLEDVELESDLELESEIELPDDLDLSDVIDADDQAETGEESTDLTQDVVETDGASAEDLVVSDDILEEAVDALNSDDDLGSDLGDTDEFDFLEGTDEASTKLDLARAYIDMGDVDGARDILEEVQSEGSDEQKAEATELLNSLD